MLSEIEFFSYLSFVMESKFDYLAECMLPSLIVLIPNTVKVKNVYI